MPVYKIPLSREMNAGDEIAEAAKTFMTSPVYAQKFVENAEEAIGGGSGGGSGTPGPSFGGDVSGLSDQALLAGVLTAEGGSAADQSYILDVINNRVASGSYPNDLRSVLLQPGQFSALNGVTGYAGGQGANDHWRAPTDVSSSLADDFFQGVWQGGGTGGALNYYQPQLASPAWGGDHFKPLPGSTHIFGTAG